MSQYWSDVAIIGPVMVRCCQHLTSTGPVLAYYGMLAALGLPPEVSIELILNWLYCLCLNSLSICDWLSFIAQ